MVSAHVWRKVYIVGILGFGLAVSTAFLVSIGQMLGVESWPIREGDFIARWGTAAGFWALLVCGVCLIVPCLAHLRRTNGPGSGKRVVLILFMVLFPYLVPYFYFARNVRNE